MVSPWLSLDDLDSPNDAYAEYAIDSASFMLWALSGRKYSSGVAKEQYVCSQFDVPAGCTWETPSSFTDGYTGVRAYIVPNHLVQTGQRYGTRFRLRRQPVRRIREVSIGGQILPSASYAIRDSSQLVIDSDHCSGLCDGPLVTYDYGTQPPSAGKLAAIALANELIKDLNGMECQLPSNVTSINRQGLSIEVYDTQDFLDKGKIGVPAVDRFIAIANPSGAKKPARVVNPDMPRGFTRNRY